jgi:hypothetical protein
VADESGQFCFELVFKSAVTGEEFETLDIALSRDTRTLGLPAPISPWIVASTIAEFIAGNAMRAAVVYTLVQCGVAWCGPFARQEETSDV